MFHLNVCMSVRFQQFEIILMKFRIQNETLHKGEKLKLVRIYSIYSIFYLKFLALFNLNFYAPKLHLSSFWLNLVYNKWDYIHSNQSTFLIGENSWIVNHRKIFFLIFSLTFQIFPKLNKIQNLDVFFRFFRTTYFANLLATNM